MESAGHDSASSLGVALFALTSALSRVVVGILSDKYQGYFTRFHWVTDSWPGTSDMSCEGFLVQVNQMEHKEVSKKNWVKELREHVQDAEKV